jgi:uncharacterized protein YukE
MSESEMKPREFDLYIDPDGYEDQICENKVEWHQDCLWAEPDVHVIEKSAYHAMKAENERLRGRIDILSKGWPAADILRFQKDRDAWKQMAEKLAECVLSVKQTSAEGSEKYSWCVECLGAYEEMKGRE